LVRQLLKVRPDWYYLLTVRNAEDSNSALLKAIIDAGSSSTESQVELIELDLGNLESVRDTAQAISRRIKAGEIPAISRLIAQAGTQFQTSELHWNKGSPRCELTFGVNHLSHALLAQILLPSLEPGARIVTLTSSSHDPEEGWGISVDYKSVEEMAVPADTDANIPGGGLQRCEFNPNPEFIDRGCRFQLKLNRRG
jgi:NAD(P)-dependent dehydrogenase (short-subunit alcohol dehydrogenase family)